MIIEFRVLAVSKEKQSYDTDMLKGVFNVEHPMLETVDALPANAAITVLTQCDWQPTVNEVIDAGNYILVPFTGIITE